MSKTRRTGSALARDSIWMFLGQASQTVIRGAYFVIIARALGPEEYGAFAAVTALAAILSPFASWGAGPLLIQTVVRCRSAFRVSWGNALLTNVMCAVALSLFIVASAHILFPASIPLELIALIAISDLLFARVVETGAMAYQAFGQIRNAALLKAVPSVAKAVGASWLWLSTVSPSALEWGVVYSVGTAAAGVFAVVWVSGDLGRPAVGRSSEWIAWKQGFYFAIGLSSQNVYNNIDKTMLARLSTLDATGIYAAAYRVLEVAFVPIRSVVYAAYARFFQAGIKGLYGSVALARKILPFGVAYALVVAAGLVILAPAIPAVLGEDYREAVTAIRLMAGVPLLRTLHYFPADALSGGGHQALRSGSQVSVALLNVALNAWLIPRYSWGGAVVATLVSDGTLVLLLWLVIWRTRRPAQYHLFAPLPEDSDAG